jgi:hypothetical protein
MATFFFMNKPALHFWNAGWNPPAYGRNGKNWVSKTLAFIGSWQAKLEKIMPRPIGLALKAKAIVGARLGFNWRTSRGGSGLG